MVKVVTVWLMGTTRLAIILPLRYVCPVKRELQPPTVSRSVNIVASVVPKLMVPKLLGPILPPVDLEPIGVLLIVGLLQKTLVHIQSIKT
jgi:hypothetical protein